MARLAWIVSCALALSACGDSGPPCSEVTEHVLQVTLAVMPAHQGMTLGNKKQMNLNCEKNMSADERRCIMKANDLNDVSSCRPRPAIPATPPAVPTSTLRPRPSPAAPSPATPPAPAPAPPAPAPGSGSAQ
jgi:hypothetical protein